MIHYMNLHPQPFEMISKGLKTIELRLYDEKRQLIKPGDTIEFTNSNNPDEVLSVTVAKLHIFKSFEELYRSLPLDLCGYLPEELPNASYKDMNIYYSEERQRKYGVVGIEIVIS